MSSADNTTGPVHIVSSHSSEEVIKYEQRRDYIDLEHKLEEVWKNIAEIRKSHADLSARIDLYTSRQDLIIAQQAAIITTVNENIGKINYILNGNGTLGLVAKVDNTEKAIKGIEEDRKEKKVQLNGLMVSVAVLLMGWIGQGAVWIFTHIKGS